MKCLIIGGNRFVGQRLSLLLEKWPEIDLYILNRTGQAPHCKSAAVYKADRRNLHSSHVDRDWDVIYDFAGFHDGDSRASVEYFQNVGHYVFISSSSVYDVGKDRTEEAFDAQALNLSVPARNTYQDGKRRAEAYFHQHAKFPVLSVRFPFILGPDDYTQRLTFHVERILRGEPIFVPNPKALISMLHSEDAARFLYWLLDHKLTGPLNVACAAPISLSHLLGQIQLISGRKPVLSSLDTPESASPYGVLDDFSVNTEKMQSAGFSARPILDWLPQLIGAPMPDGPKGYIH